MYFAWYGCSWPSSVVIGYHWSSLAVIGFQTHPSTYMYTFHLSNFIFEIIRSLGSWGVFNLLAFCQPIARRYGPRTIRTTANTAHCGDRRRNETATPATFTEVPTQAPPPSHRGAWLAVTDTPPTTVMSAVVSLI